MGADYVIYEKTGAIARVTLNKPEKLNAFNFLGNGEDAQQFDQALERAAEDDDVKVVIIRGAGRAFCVGQDLGKVGFLYGFGTGQSGERRPSQRIRLKTDRRDFENHLRLLLHPKITVAQVHGHCIEGGCLIAMLCDITIASEDAIFGFPAQRLGFAGSGSPIMHLLIQIVGLRRARYLLLTGKRIDARQAERIGLVCEVVPRDQLESQVEGLATALSQLPKDGIAIGKAHMHMIYDSLGSTTSIAQAYVMHTLFTNVRFEEGEWNFFRSRRDKGVREAFHERDQIWDQKLREP